MLSDRIPAIGGRCPEVSGIEIGEAITLWSVVGRAEPKCAMYFNETTNVGRANAVNVGNRITVGVHLQLARDTRVPYREVDPLFG